MPPPPPPPPPAPPPMFGGGGNLANTPAAKPVDRSALLGEIRGGARLKKVEAVNDRSAPIIDGKKSSSGNSLGGGVSSPAAPSMGASKANGPSNGPPLALGGLFAQGMPKLRPTGARTASNGRNQSSSSSSNSQDQHSRSQPASPLTVTRNGVTSTLRNFNTLSGKKDVRRTETNTNNNNSSSSNSSDGSYGSQKRLPFPNDITPNNSGANRGPPPPPPSASQKPQLVNAFTNGSTSCTSQKQQTDIIDKPAPPSKPPGVTRSASQTNLNGVIGNRPVQRPAPTTRPPPPPKQNASLGGGPPALPSKPPNLSRRKSFGGPDLRNGMSFLHNQPPNQQIKQAPSHYHAGGYGKSGGPPPPPRNISVPDSLNNLQEQQQQQQLQQQQQRVAAPPAPSMPPPPPPPSSAKMNVPQGMLPGRSMPNLAPAPPLKPPNARPPPPPTRSSPNIGPPTSAPPPPPPHHKMAYHPGSGNLHNSAKQTAPMAPNHMALSNGAPPPPPTRNATLSRVTPGGNLSSKFPSEDLDPFEARFASRFPPIEELPRPPQFGDIQKTYPSKVQLDKHLKSSLMRESNC